MWRGKTVKLVLHNETDCVLLPIGCGPDVQGLIRVLQLVEAGIQYPIGLPFSHPSHLLAILCWVYFTCISPELNWEIDFLGKCQYHEHLADIYSLSDLKFIQKLGDWFLRGTPPRHLSSPPQILLAPRRTIDGRKKTHQE